MRTIVIVTALVAVAGCKKNAAYCSAAAPACGPGFTCDTTAHECLPLAGGGDLGGGGSTDMASGCAQACGGNAPICVIPDCQACTTQSDPEGACFALDPTTPHCLTAGGDAGSCVACRDNTDCPDPNTPYCDGTSHVCRGCVDDAECPSLVCDLVPDSTTRNHCVSMDQVEYVDGSATTNGNGLTPATPRQKLQDGINHAVGADNRPYVHVAAGSYGENAGNSTAGKSVFLVGATGAIVNPANGDALSVSGGGILIARNIVAAPAKGNGVNCLSGSFTAYHSQFINSTMQLGVYASSCQLLLDGVWVSGNATGGISVGGGNFTIINSIIAHNTGPGVNQIATSGTMTFVNNTVADNTSGGTTTGVICQVTGGFMVVNSILYGNKGAGSVINETNCMGSFNASDDPSAGPQSTVDLTTKAPGFKATVPISPDSYHLLPTSPCLDEGTSTGVPDHDYDLEPRPDARTMKLDIGADELP